MADITAGSVSTQTLRDDYMALTQRRRLYTFVLLAVFIFLLIAGFRTADGRNAMPGGSGTGWARSSISPKRS